MCVYTPLYRPAAGTQLDLHVDLLHAVNLSSRNLPGMPPGGASAACMQQPRASSIAIAHWHRAARRRWYCGRARDTQTIFTLLDCTSTVQQFQYKNAKKGAVYLNFRQKFRFVAVANACYLLRDTVALGTYAKIYLYFYCQTLQMGANDAPSYCLKSCTHLQLDTWVPRSSKKSSAQKCIEKFKFIWNRQFKKSTFVILAAEVQQTQS
jgi:hypothetical protein